MTANALRLPFSLDPLIAEAKRRARQRRVLLTTVLLFIVAVAAVAVSASRSPGGPHSAGPSRSQLVKHSTSNLSQVSVPIDATERQWRAWVLSHGFGLTVGARPNLVNLQRTVRSTVAATGARLVRLKVWQSKFELAPVEVVVVTATPAAYLRHRLARLVSLLGKDNRYVFVKAVDRSGSLIFEWTTRTNRGLPEGSVDVPSPLQGCSPVASWGNTPPPCPVG